MAGEIKAKDILLVFTKNPVLGHAKTRIAERVGEDEALRIYLELLRITREQAQPLEAEKWVCYSQYVPNNDAWQMAGFCPYLQFGEGLGSRMATAFAEAFTEAQRVVLIGSDAPTITTALLQTAFDALLNNDLVLGPSEDGGYYLIGLSRPMPSLFQGIPWSSPQVWQRTIQQASRLGLQASELPALYDVDYIEDWERFLRS